MLARSSILHSKQKGPCHCIDDCAQESNSNIKIQCSQVHCMMKLSSCIARQESAKCEAQSVTMGVP